jgi:hypothetical protein
VQDFLKLLNKLNRQGTFRLRECPGTQLSEKPQSPEDKKEASEKFQASFSLFPVSRDLFICHWLCSREGISKPKAT